jgi:hypothetical protein
MAARPGLDLESPFLSDELFAREPESGSETRAKRLASESPFLSALEPDQGALADPESIEQPGSRADEEAWDAEMPIDEAELDSVAIEHVAADAGSRPGGAVAIPAIKSPPSLQIVTPTQKPMPNARWAIHQKDAIFQGTLNREGWTGSIDRGSGKFDLSQPFRIHVEGCVCSIVSGAVLLAKEPEVEYGGQFVDWNLADAPDFQKRGAFWSEYEKARAPRAPLDIFRFLQHDHVMRRPVKLLARHTRAVFEARPLAIRLGPIVRHVDSHRALIWLELETPGMVRVSYGKATNQRELPKTSEAPMAQSQSHTTSVRVGGRYYALVWLDALDADTAYQYTIALAPLPPSGPLAIAPADFTETVFPRQQTFWSRSNTNSVLKTASFSDSEWLCFRTAAARADALRFAHGSCRKYPGDHDEHNHVPGPDMLEAFSAHLLAKKNWADWPQFFLHSGDQIYADDVGVAMGRAILRHRFASVLPGPGPVGAGDVTFGAWAGRVGWRYSVRATGPAKPSPDDVDPKYLRSFFDYRGRDRALVDSVIDAALVARRLADVARNMADATRPLRHKLRVMNELLWRVPVSERDIPTIDKVRGLRTREAYAIKHRNRSYQLEYPSAGDVTGVHAADYAEYAALYEQAWSQPGTRRLLAHLPSFMIFDDHEVTDDWNADPSWLKIVHSKADPLRCWPTTMTDALCAYWVYQGWGNLAPEQWASDPRVQVLERCRKEGRDALPELRRLVFSRSVQPTAPGADASKKLDWHFALPTVGVPFLAIDLRTDRDVNGGGGGPLGGMSPQRLRWLEDALAKTRSLVAFVVLPVPYLMPDPMLFANRHPGFVARMAGARSTAAFKRGSDIEHPAGNPVWEQIKGMLRRLQQSSALKTLVIVSGDIHFSCNLDGQLPDSHKAPRLLQLISSGLQQRISDAKQSKLDSAYRGWLNVISGAQGVDEHRGVRITLGGLHGPAGKKSNFLFDTSVAVVDLKIVPFGTPSNQIRVPLIVQTHLVRSAHGALVPYTFRHMTQADGSAVMSLKDPGFRHPASPKDYPATSGGIGIAKEFDRDDEAFNSGADLLLFEDAQAPPDEVETVHEIEAGFPSADEFEEEASDDSVGELEDKWVGAADGEVADWAAGIDLFPAEPTVAFHINDGRMVEAFAPVTVSTASHLCAALVDLTDNPAMPPYAGLNDEEMIYAGSLPKICVMYAAFALRSRVQAFVDAAAANGAPVLPPGMTSEIEKAWKPKLRALFLTRPAMSFGNNQDITFPKLDQILTFSPEGKVDFARATPPLTDARIDMIRDKGAPQGMFHDWMRSMLRWSNNTAASKCILALGYFYLNGALARAGLFDAANRNGLWLAADYKSHDWVKTEAERQANAAGLLLTPRWATAQGRRRSNITATAAQVARFMTLLAQDKLVDATASHEMRALMNITPGGIGSYAKFGLDAVGRGSTAFAAKIGFGDDRFSHDCAIIERTVAGKDLRYVAVGLGSAPNRKRKDLRDLFVLLDETIVTRNR